MFWVTLFFDFSHAELRILASALSERSGVMLFFDKYLLYLPDFLIRYSGTYSKIS